MTASKKKIVIVGVSGLLGRSLFNIIGKKKNILGTYFKNKPNLKIKKLLKCNLENLNSCLVITKNCKNLYMCGGPVFSKNGKITEEEFFFKNSKIFLNLFIAAIKNKVNTITWVSSAKVYKTSRGKLSENSTKNNIFGFNISS